MVSVPVESRRHGQYRPPPADADVVATIRPECAAARVQSGYPPGVTYHVPEPIERQHAVVAAVEVDECARRVERQTARIDDPRIAAERSHRLAFGVGAENHTVAAAVGAARAGDKELRNSCFCRTTSSSHDARTLLTLRGESAHRRGRCLSPPRRAGSAHRIGDEGVAGVGCPADGRTARCARGLASKCATPTAAAAVRIA